MKVWLFSLCALLLFSLIYSSTYGDLTDNEFAEFEDFDAEEEVFTNHDEPCEDEDTDVEKDDGFTNDFTNDEDDQDGVVEDDSEFEHFQDTEEFEGYGSSKDEKPAAEPEITIASVPIHFRTNWDSYWCEILMMSGLVVYFINFMTGKNKNSRFANLWFQTHRSLLEENFSLVGDDMVPENREGGVLIKESENIFTLWCSGRVCCEGMLVELKLNKRQDLVAIIGGMLRPVLDQVHIKVVMNKEDMDTFVFCVASKKTSLYLSKEMADICIYCPERRSGDKHNIPSHFNVMSEIFETTAAILDSKVTAVLNKYKDLIDYIHISDQYSGVKQPDDNGSLKLPETQKVLLFGLNIPVKNMSLNEAMEQVKPLMTMVLYCMDKVKRYRLSKEGKAKADKNRQRVEEAFLKSTHSARAEAAAAKREERKRQEKEKVMADMDPEKQRRWEEKEQKRQAKKRAPKMKQLKVKAL